MNTRCSMVVLGVLALAAQASLARADGTITGLTLNLPAIKTCAVETITVNGTGQCGNVDVDFGDSHKLINLSLGHPISFPAVYHHAYAKLGTYTVRAQSFQDRFNKCPGVASATVQVAAGPWITTMFLFSQVTPGGAVMLVGENFGNLPGKVLLHLKYYDGTASDVPLQSLQWGDTFAAGIVPAVSRAVDQDTTITLIAQCGATSNGWPANFTAARDAVDLADVGNAPGHWSPWFQCSMSSGATGSDQCEDSGSDNFPIECSGGIAPWGLGPSGLGNLGGYHASGWGVQGDPGDDLFWMNSPLQNGWVLDSTSADWITQVNNGGQVSVNLGETTDPGTSSPMLDVNWNINNCGAVFYSGHMIVTGPLGVPY